MREYTGFDKFADAKRPGLEALVAAMQDASGAQVWNNGTLGRRKKRGAENSHKMSGWSIHSTGRAADISRRNYHGRPGCTRADMLRVAEWLVAVADDIGLEYLADYEFSDGGAAGRGWRCDRDAWQTYRPGVIKGGGSGDWLHLEISNEKAESTDWVDSVMVSFPLGKHVPKIDTGSGWVTCRKGDEGGHVRNVQMVLHDEGYKNSSGKKPIVVDGLFGVTTDRRVRQYQKANGLTVDGIVGPQTAGHMGLLDT
jgi:murein L,D-transpeptidase YcbB/YkuD